MQLQIPKIQLQILQYTKLICINLYVFTYTILFLIYFNLMKP